MSGYLALNSRMGHNGNNNGSNATNIDMDNISPADRAIGNQLLIAAVKDNSEDKISEALRKGADVNYIFPHPDLATALHIAVRNNQNNLVGLLLEEGAHPNIQEHGGRKYLALHYAAENGNYEIIKLLISKGANVNAKEGDLERTCLHIIALKWNTNKESYTMCLDELLLHDEIQVDSRDNRGATPLFLAAKKEWRYMVERLIMKGTNLEVTTNETSVEEYVLGKYPDIYKNIDKKKIEKPKRAFGEELYTAMKNRDITSFQNIMESINLSKSENVKMAILEEEHGGYTLLGYACKSGITEVVRILIYEGADILKTDTTTDLNSLLLAAKGGYHEILRLLTESMFNQGYLIKGCLQACDKKGETALHKVAKREDFEVNEDVNYKKCMEVLLDLKKYINIDAVDEFNQTPLHYAVLCDDQSLVKELLLAGANLGVKNKFGILAIARIRPEILLDVLDESVEQKNNIADRDFEIILHYSLLAPGPDQQPEANCLKFLSRSKEHRHLLLHPVIDTFLYLKWQRIRRYYFLNLAMYFTFVVLLTTYILSFIKDAKEQTKLVEVNSDAINIPEKNAGWRVTLQILIMTFWLILVIREVIQLFVSWKTYWKYVENWLEVGIIAATLTLICFNLSLSVQKGLSAWIILATWIELVLTLGRHPLFAVYITMFTTVSYNFIKFILMFSFIIFAFTISFLLVFKLDENKQFENYHKTLLKTVAMTAGELEYTELPLGDLPVFSHVLFIVFVFLIILVLMNLLNGLAVSDIQLIQKEAELVSYRSRVELISYIESVLLANPFSSSFAGNNTQSWVNSQKNPLVKILHYLGQRTLVFKNCLRNNHKIALYPNKSTKERWYVCECHKYEFKEGQIESAKTVVLNKRDTDAISNLQGKVDGLKEQLNCLTQLIKNKIDVKPAVEWREKSKYVPSVKL